MKLRGATSEEKKEQEGKPMEIANNDKSDNGKIRQEGRNRARKGRQRKLAILPAYQIIVEGKPKKRPDALLQKKKSQQFRESEDNH